MEEKNIQPPVDPQVIQASKTADDEIFLEIKQSDALDNVTKTREFNLLDIYNKINDWMIDHSPIKFEEKLLFCR